MIHDFWRLLRIAGAALLVGALTPAPVSAQTGPTAEELKKLVKTLETDVERKKFLGTLKQLIEARKATTKPKPKSDPFIETLEKSFEKLGNHLVYAAKAIVEAPAAWDWLVRQVTSPSLRALWWEIIWKVVLALIAGILAELLARLLLRPYRRRVESKASETWIIRALYLGVRTVLDILPIGAFAVAGWISLDLVDPGIVPGDVADLMILASVIARGIVSIARMLFAPQATTLRLFHLQDGTARAWFRWIRRLANVIVYPYFLLVAAMGFALTPEAFTALVKLLGLVVLIMLISATLKARRPVRQWLKVQADDGDDTSDTLAETTVGRVGDVWHILAVTLLIACYVTWVLDIEGGFAFLFRGLVFTILIVVAVRLLLSAAQRLVAFLVHSGPDAGDHLLAQRAKRYTGPAQSAAQILVYFLGFLALLQAWQINIVGWFGTGVGQEVLGRGISIIVILVIAVIAWELTSEMTERYMRRLSGDQGAGQRQARMRTLLPLMQKVLLVAIIVVTSFIILSELGVNIAPLLAGAGVLGLAVGFGAQTLVKDVITGIFNIIEDTMAVGDVVSAAGHSGTVEDISIRSVVLRDYSGTVHSIPFSSISSVENMTKRFAYAVMDFGVGYRENTDEVAGVLREIGAGLREDATFGGNIMADLEIAGVQELGDSAVVVRCRFQCRAGAQWGVKREMNRRVKLEFDARGIEIPFPHQTIYFGEDKDGRAPPAYVRMVEKTPPPPTTPKPPEPPEPPRPEKPSEKREKLDPAVHGDD